MAARAGCASQCPPARVGGAEGRGERGQCGLTWSGWWVLSGLPAIFSPAARGVWAETKPSQSQDTVQTHRGAAETALTSHGEAVAETPAASRTLAAACSL